MIVGSIYKSTVFKQTNLSNNEAQLQQHRKSKEKLKRILPNAVSETCGLKCGFESLIMSHQWLLQTQSLENDYDDELPKVPRFIILGKPFTGKSYLAQRLCSIWGCKYVNASYLIYENIKNETSLGLKLQSIMRSGKDLDDAIVIKMVAEKLNSSDCISSGYILDDIPNHSEKSFSIPQQLNMLLTMKNSPNCIIYLQVPDDQNRLWCANKRVDVLTGNIYTMTQPTTNQEGRAVPQLYSYNCLSPTAPLIHMDISSRLLIRHEDLPENINAHFKFHNEVILPCLKRFFSKLGKAPVIYIEGSSDNKVLFENTIKALYEYSDKTELGLLNLFGDTTEEHEKNRGSISSTDTEKSTWRRLGKILCLRTL